jgi:hypothetical protein
MKLTDDYAAGNPDAHKSQVDERYRLIASLDPIDDPRFRRFFITSNRDQSPCEVDTEHYRFIDQSRKSGTI